MSAVASPPVRVSIPTRDRAAEAKLQVELRIPAIVAAILVRKGWTDPEAAYKFLHPALDDLGSPKKLPDYEAAKNCLLDAKDRGEKIFVHGDYDADGVTSAALLTRFLGRVGCNVHAHVPHRMREGYGIHLMAVDAAHEAGAKVFLTCDCGVSAHEQVAKATELGMKVVVTDHHSIGDSLPGAVAVMNPHREDSEYPFSELSGVGVAFRFCEGLAEELGLKKEQYRRAFLDLAAVGTIADVMPLQGENRIIAKHGLKELLVTRKEGLKALLKVTKVQEKCNGKLKVRDIGFGLGPRINATGRIDDAARSLRLLMTNDAAEAMRIAEEMEAINLERRAEQDRMIEEAIKQVEELGLHKNPAIIVSHDSWHPGIIGLVASRLVEQFRRPAYVMHLNREDGVLKGSARSIDGFHLADSLRAQGELVSGGGHAKAAGFSAKLDRLEDVVAAFTAYAGERLTEDDFVLKQVVDAEVDASEFNMSTVEALEMLEPYGEANFEPMFLARDMTFTRILPTKNPAHTRVSLKSGNGPLISATAFGHGPVLNEMEAGFTADVIFTACVNEYLGNRSMQWNIKHFGKF